MRAAEIIGKSAAVVFAALSVEAFSRGNILIAGYWLGMALFCLGIVK